MKLKFKSLIICSIFVLSISYVAWATELYIPALNGKAGQSLEIPVMFDVMDNLAGMKLVIKYDADILEFKKADKTQYSSPLMHIVNDKNPGILVIVMAGARGISGKDFPVLSLKFDVKNDLKGKNATQIEITEAQLMTDQLKNIEYSIKINPLNISSDVLVPESENIKTEIKNSESDVKKNDEVNRKAEIESQIPNPEPRTDKCTLRQLFGY